MGKEVRYHKVTKELRYDTRVPSLAADYQLISMYPSILIMIPMNCINRMISHNPQ